MIQYDEILYGKMKSAKEISTKYERRESSMRWLDYRIIDGTIWRWEKFKKGMVSYIWLGLSRSY